VISTIRWVCDDHVVLWIILGARPNIVTVLLLVVDVRKTEIGEILCDGTIAVIRIIYS
jgi:hypothetical protein